MSVKINPPLRYPGSKSRANKILRSTYDLVVPRVKDYRESFIGGGSVALYLATEIWKDPDTRPSIWINDLYVPLYSFWWALQNRPDELIRAVTKIRKDNSKSGDGEVMRVPFFAALEVVKKFESAGSVKSDDDRLEAAINYYIVNRCCRSGMTSIFSEWASRPDKGGTFVMKKINELKAISNVIQGWKITNEDYSVLLKSPYDGDPKDVFVFLDPPYMLGDLMNLYGTNGEMHKGFPHEQFKKDTMSCKFNWLITYGAKTKDGEELLKGWFRLHEPHFWPLRYSMQQSTTAKGDKKTKIGRELLISNFGYGNLPKLGEHNELFNEFFAVDKVGA